MFGKKFQNANSSHGRTAIWAGLVFGLCWNATFADDTAPKGVGPVSPQDSIPHFQLHPDLKIELVASEPQVIDPVAMAFDEKHQLWVVEMRDYPNGPGKGEPPQSRIRLLKDKDGDGFYETAHTFADRLLFANGIQPWKGGVIVTMAGEVAYFKDTNNDGKADVKETWFTGFKAENPQLRANHPTFGLDNQIYIANGLRGGVVIAAKAEWKKNAKPVSISGQDFRFDPLSGKYEAISGVGQFGLTFDAFGNRFVCSNRNPCKHIILESKYLARNPHFAASQVAHDVSPAATDSHVYPLVNAWTTSTLHAGQFTAACGVTIYQGDALPDKFQGNSFTCEPTGSLVHRDVLKPKGATFTSQPGREGVEFLASRDSWFRPVNMAHGPDGALYVVDMYRAVIEHPQFMPNELKNRRDLTDGNDRGRIYRIVPKDQNLTQRTREENAKWLVKGWPAMLDHPNYWHRELASRMIYESQNLESVPTLQKHVASANTPEGRVRSLWALKGLNKLTLELVEKALDDPHPRVVEQAIKLSEPWLNEHPNLLKKFTKLAGHSDARVRYQLALSLGAIKDRKTVVDLLLPIALQSSEDEWTRAAVLSSVGDQASKLMLAVLHYIQHTSKLSTDRKSLLAEMARVLGSQNQAEEIRGVLEELAKHHAEKPAVVEPLLIGLAEGLAKRRQSLGAAIAGTSAESQKVFAQVFQNSAEEAGSSKEKLNRRLACLDLLRFADAKISAPVLKKLAVKEPNQSLRVKAIGMISRIPDPDVAEKLLTGFRANSPAVRRASLDCLLANSMRTKALLKAISEKKLAVNELSPAQVKRLTGHGDAAIKTEARKLLAAAIPEDRVKVLKEYQPIFTLKANAKNGRAVFVKNCAACHQIGKDGVNVAPDIADSRTRQPATLLTNILDPNRAIDNNYFSFTVLTTAGLSLTGIIETETATSITLKQAEGKTVTILRSEIEALKSDGVSLMPVGLEKNITKQQMADLISYIKNWRYLEDGIPID